MEQKTRWPKREGEKGRWFNQRYVTLSLYVFLTFAACTLFYLLASNFGQVSAVFSNLWQLLLPFVIGGGVAYLLNFTMCFFEEKVVSKVFAKRKKPWKKKKTERLISLTATFVVWVALLAVFFTIVIPQIGISLANIASRTNQYASTLMGLVDKLAEYMGRFDFSREQIDFVMSKVNERSNGLFGLLNQALPYVVDFTKSLTVGVKNLVLGIIISIYILFNKELFFAQLRKVCYAFLPKETVVGLEGLSRDTHRIFSGFFMGKLLDSLIIGVICFVGMTILRLPYSMLISVIVGVTNIIPYFGPIIGAIPSGLLVLMVDPMQCLWFVIFILVLQQFDGNILGPKILGDSTGLSAFWVIFAILLFGGLFGFVGMFVGVPTFSVIYMLVRRGISKRLSRRRYPTDTAAYEGDALVERMGPAPPQEPAKEGEQA